MVHPDIAEGPTKRIAPVSLLRREWGQLLLFAGLGGFFVLVFFGSLRATLFLLVAAGLAIAAMNLAAVKAMFKWRAPDLEVASTGYRLGESTTVRYRRASKRPLDISHFSLQGELICEELVRYRQGTDTETETRQVLSHKITGEGEGTADGLVGEITIYVTPHAGMPTFRADHNEVTWYLELSTSGDSTSLPGDSHRFEIDVVTAIASRPVQDS